MREALYYPTFFARDEKWLKFALLYLGKVVSIIPSETDISVSNLHRIVLQETDLLSSHSPTESEVNLAADDLGDEIARISNNYLNRNGNQLNMWRNSRSFDSEIYDGKMSYKLQQMLLSEEWAIPTNRGLRLNDELALIYMILLANSISSQRSIPTITDRKLPVNFSHLDRRINNRTRNYTRFKTLFNQIYVDLPRNLENVRVEEIIDFRNNPKNRRNLDEFHKAIDDMSQLTDANMSESDMLYIKKSLFDAKRQYLSCLAGQFVVGSGSVLGIYQLISGDAPHLDFLREVLGFGAIEGLSRAYGNLTQLRTTNKAISYISDVENISSRLKMRRRSFF